MCNQPWLTCLTETLWYSTYQKYILLYFQVPSKFSLQEKLLVQNRVFFIASEQSNVRVVENFILPQLSFFFFFDLLPKEKLVSKFSFIYK